MQIHFFRQYLSSTLLRSDLTLRIENTSMLLPSRAYIAVESTAGCECECETEKERERETETERHT